MDFKQFIISESDHWLAINKPTNISIQPDKTQDISLLEHASDYLSGQAYVINRIDRPVSGLVLIGKNAEAQNQFRELFAQRLVRKYYLAITKNKPEPLEDKLHHHLYKNEQKNKSYIRAVSDDRTRDAYLIYQFVRSIEKYHLLKIRLITGRHHQIRAQLAHINCPIRGDIKYGYPRANRVHSIQLHAWKLHFQDPWTKRNEWIYATPPQENIWKAFEIDKIKKEEEQVYGKSEEN